MKNTQKGFIVPLLIAIVAVLTVGGGVYVWKKSKSQQPITDNKIVSILTDKVAGWKTYTSSKYGYTFNYPGDWVQDDQTIINDNVNDIPELVYVHNKDKSYVFSVTVSSKEWLLKNEAPLQQKVVIDGVSKTAYIFPNGYECFGENSTGDCSTFTIPIYHNGLWYNITASNQAKTVEGIYTQIISTFKFTTPTNQSTSNWKTYTNIQHGIEFKYPNDWKIFYENAGGVNIEDTKRPSKPDSDSPYNGIGVSFAPEIKTSLGWGQGFGDVPIKTVYVSSNNVLITMTALTANDQIVEDKILSTFKFTTPTTQPSVTVLSPNGGAFQTGSVVAIKWTGANQLGKVRILAAPWDTKDSNMKVGFYYIADAISNSGSYLWTVPNSLTTDKYKSTLSSSGQYFIRIDCYQNCGGTVSDPVIIGETDQPFVLTLSTPQSILPTTCVDQQEGVPVITSLSSDSGSVGSQIEIRGCNFAGFEGDKNAWIENIQGVKGIIYGDVGSTGKLLKLTLKSSLCQVDNSYSGLPCSSYLNLTPGTYKIYTTPWGKKSNEATFTIK